jgi:hypothetical protein
VRCFGMLQKRLLQKRRRAKIKIMAAPTRALA